MLRSTRADPPTYGGAQTMNDGSIYLAPPQSTNQAKTLEITKSCERAAGAVGKWRNYWIFRTEPAISC
jgi:hypothetical protein